MERGMRRFLPLTLLLLLPAPALAEESAGPVVINTPYELSAVSGPYATEGLECVVLSDHGLTVASPHNRTYCYTAGSLRPSSINDAMLPFWDTLFYSSVFGQGQDSWLINCSITYLASEADKLSRDLRDLTCLNEFGLGFVESQANELDLDKFTKNDTRFHIHGIAINLYSDKPSTSPESMVSLLLSPCGIDTCSEPSSEAGFVWTEVTGWTPFGVSGMDAVLTGFVLGHRDIGRRFLFLPDNQISGIVTN